MILKMKRRPPGAKQIVHMQALAQIRVSREVYARVSLGKRKFEEIDDLAEVRMKCCVCVVSLETNIWKFKLNLLSIPKTAFAVRSACELRH